MRWALLASLALVLAAAMAATARAAFPGAPGPIAYSKVRNDEVTGTAGGLLAHSPRRLGANRRLTGDPADRSPSYSPDGRLVAFSRATVFPALGTHVYVVNADGSGVRALTAGSDIDANPSFSADGERVVFDRRPATGGPSHIFVVNLDGSGLRQLTSGPASDSDPTFTPNGRRIVFVSDRDRDARTDRSDIFSMRPNGTGVRVLLGGPRSESEPDVSPDGRRIVFTSNRNRGPNVFTARINGRDVRQLTHSRRDCFSGSCYLHPSWAPDGRHIALVSEGRYSSDLEVMRTDGSHRREFEGAGTESEGFGSEISDPGWGPRPR